MSQLALSVLGAVFLIGAALFLALRSDRRRESRQRRLRSIVATGPSDDAPTLSLRRPLSRAGIRDFLLLSALWTRLGAALDAAGNRIGLPHLIAAGLVAAGTTVLFAEKVMGFKHALTVLIGSAAAVAVPTVLLRFE